MKTISTLTSLIAISALVGCASIPTGPSVLVLQGSGKSFTQFSQDDFYCRDFALRQIGGKSPGQAGRDAGVASAVAGTAIGAAVGAAVGGSEGAGVGVGAGTGLLLGSAAGSDAYNYSTQSGQQQYDHAYIQCMYGAGHKVPVPAGLRLSETGSQRPQNQTPPPPPPSSRPPPPPPSAR